MHQRLQCTTDNYFFRIKLVFFLYLLLSEWWKENDLSWHIAVIRQTVGVPNTSIYSAVFLASKYHNYLQSAASTTMTCWCCHSNSVNTGSRLSNISDVKTRKRRNIIEIDMIRNINLKYGLSWRYTWFIQSIKLYTQYILSSHGFWLFVVPCSFIIWMI